MSTIEEIQEVTNLLIKYKKQRITKKEAVKLQNWVSKSKDNEQLFNKLTDENYLRKRLAEIPDMDKFKEAAWSKIFKRISTEGDIVISYDKVVDCTNDGASRIITDTRVVNNTLLALAKKDPSMVYKMKPREFENLVAELFEKKGYSIKLTKETRDGGKDFFIVEQKELGDFLFYVECKKYAQHRPVAVNVVRELYGVIVQERATAGMIITSSYFSPDAKDFTKTINHQMSLVDFAGLCKLIKNT